MDTSDLSTTEAHSDVEGATRTRHSPARYSPTQPQENRHQLSSTTAVSETPTAIPQTPVSIPGGLRDRSSVLIGQNSNTKQQSPVSVSLPTCRPYPASYASTSVDMLARDSTSPPSCASAPENCRQQRNDVLHESPVSTLSGSHHSETLVSVQPVHAASAGKLIFQSE